MVIILRSSLIQKCGKASGIVEAGIIESYKPKIRVNRDTSRANITSRSGYRQTGSTESTGDTGSDTGLAGTTEPGAGSPGSAGGAGSHAGGTQQQGGGHTGTVGHTQRQTLAMDDSNGMAIVGVSSTTLAAATGMYLYWGCHRYRVDRFTVKLMILISNPYANMLNRCAEDTFLTGKKLRQKATNGILTSSTMCYIHHMCLFRSTLFPNKSTK